MSGRRIVVLLIQVKAHGLSALLGSTIANHWLFGPILADALAGMPETNAMIATTGTVTVLEAGQADNVMPSHACA